MIRQIALARAATIALLALVCLAVDGCQGSSSSGSGFPIERYEDLKPDNLTLKETGLEIAGSKYKAEIRQSRNGDEVKLDLVVNGEVIFESERYLSTKEAFSVIDAGGDQYEKPIPLIKYPMHVGDSWDWKGRDITGPASREAEAKITTASEAMTINGGSVPNVVRVEVALAIDSGIPGSPSKRKMVFWIAPNMGVVKRASGDYSSRAPLEK